MGPAARIAEAAAVWSSVGPRACGRSPRRGDGHLRHSGWINAAPGQRLGRVACTINRIRKPMSYPQPRILFSVTPCSVSMEIVASEISGHDKTSTAFHGCCMLTKTPRRHRNRVEPRLRSP